MENVELYQGPNKEWYFRIKASNGLIVAQSEGYKDKRNAVKGIEAVAKAFAPPDPDPTDPDTPPAIAFAKTYAAHLSKYQAGISAVVQQRNETTLAEIVLRAAGDGWTILPPVGVAAPVTVTTSQVPVVEVPAPEAKQAEAPKTEPKAAPKARGRRKASA